MIRTRPYVGSLGFRGPHLLGTSSSTRPSSVQSLRPLPPSGTSGRPTRHTLSSLPRATARAAHSRSQVSRRGLYPSAVSAEHEPEPIHSAHHPRPKFISFIPVDLSICPPITIPSSSSLRSSIFVLPPEIPPLLPPKSESVSAFVPIASFAAASQKQNGGGWPRFHAPFLAQHGIQVRHIRRDPCDKLGAPIAVTEERIRLPRPQAPLRGRIVEHLWLAPPHSTFVLDTCSNSGRKVTWAVNIRIQTPAYCLGIALRELT